MAVGSGTARISLGSGAGESKILVERSSGRDTRRPRDLDVLCVLGDAAKLGVGGVVQRLGLVARVGLLLHGTREGVLAEDRLVAAHEGEVRLLHQL